MWSKATVKPKEACVDLLLTMAALEITPYFVQKNTFFCASLVMLVYLLPQQTNGYTLGTDITLIFHHELKGHHEDYIVDAHLHGSDQPFIVNGHLNPGGLRPGQAERFQVEVPRAQRNLTISIHILELDMVDEGLYIVSIVENNGGTRELYSYETFVTVTYRPGRAKCAIQNPSLPASHWLTVHCNATVGSDNHGHLVCLQNSKQLPYLQQVTYDGDHMTCTFWILYPESEIRCCSTENSSEIDYESCDDFIYSTSEERISTKEPDLGTTALATFIPLIPDGDTTWTSEYAEPIITVLGTLLSVFVVMAVIFFGRHMWKVKNGNRETIDRIGPKDGRVPHTPAEEVLHFI